MTQVSMYVDIPTNVAFPVLERVLMDGLLGPTGVRLDPGGGPATD